MDQEQGALLWPGREEEREKDEAEPSGEKPWGEGHQNYSGVDWKGGWCTRSRAEGTVLGSVEKRCRANVKGKESGSRTVEKPPGESYSRSWAFKGGKVNRIVRSGVTERRGAPNKEKDAQEEGWSATIACDLVRAAQCRVQEH